MALPSVPRLPPLHKFLFFFQKLATPVPCSARSRAGHRNLAALCRMAECGGSSAKRFLFSAHVVSGAKLGSRRLYVPLGASAILKRQDGWFMTPDARVCFSRATSSPSCWCCGEERPIKHSSVHPLRFSSTPPVFDLHSTKRIPTNQTMCLMACLYEAETTRRIIHDRGRENQLLQNHLFSTHAGSAAARNDTTPAVPTRVPGWRSCRSLATPIFR